MSDPTLKSKTPTLPMKERQRLMREDAILDAATELLQKKGFAAMTLEDVTDAIGISRPTLYQHFKSKEDLVAHIAARSLRQGCQTLQAMDSATPPEARLRAFIHWCVTVRFVILGGVLSEFASTALSQDQRFPVFQCAREEFHLELVGLIRLAQRCGQVRQDIDSELLVELLLGFLKNPGLDALIQAGRATPDSIEQAVWQLLKAV